MLDFALSPDQEALRRRGHRFAHERMRPVAADLDRSGAWPEQVIQAAWDAGLLQACVPADLGGPGHSALEEALVAEELGWGCAGLFTTLNANALSTMPLRLAGTAEQQRRFLAPFLDRPTLAAFALTEPEAGSDVGAITCRAERRGDCYVLDGLKCYCTSAARAAWIVVFARSGMGRGTQGLSAFIVPMDLPGLCFGPPVDKLGHRASEQVEVQLRQVEIPVSFRLGEEGSGFALAMATLDRTRATVAAAAVGLGRAALELATGHARSRVQFGRPLIQHEALAFKLADLATRLEAARLLVWQAAWRVDQGLPNGPQSAMAKAFATDAAMELAAEAVQVMGGKGYLKTNPAEKLFRDAKLMQIYEGANEIQRLVIARSLR